MKYKAIIFDLDGTLLDSVPVILKSAKVVFDEMGIPYNETDLRKSIGIPLRIQAKRFALDRDTEFVNLYRLRYRSLEDIDLRLFPGTIEMLKTIKSRGCLIGLVTSKSARATHAAIEKTGIREYFDVVVTADDVKKYKPDPEPVFKALEALGINKEDAVYIGDSAFDIDMATRAEIASISVTWGARNREDLELMCPNFVADDWQEMIDWLSEEQTQIGNFQ